MRTHAADSVSAPGNATIAALAARAGFQIEWQDAHGQTQRVPDATLARLLECIGLPCSDDASLQQSLETIEAESPHRRLPPLITGVVDEPIILPRGVIQPGMRYELVLDDGASTSGEVSGDGDDDDDDDDDDTSVSIPAIAHAGYHVLRVEGSETTLAIAPSRCFSIADALAQDAQRPNVSAAAATPGAVPSATPGSRSNAPAVWGVSAQVYGLRREDDAGVGDFTALGMLARACAAGGAAALAISPMHAMFSADPGKFSPYSPSSRLFRNVLHIDPAAHFGASEVAQAIDALELGPTLRELENAPLIDWPGVAAARLAVLRYLFDRAQSQNDTRLDGLHAFRKAGGAALERHARFEALHAYRVASWKRAEQRDAERSDRTDGNGDNDRDAPPSRGATDRLTRADHDAADIGTAQQAYDWRHWPEALRDPASAAVDAFARAHRSDVDFHLFLQWLADEGLAQAQHAARDAGMPIGLIADLAVGCDSVGSQTWSDPTSMLRGVSVGAPPDLFNQAGQSWGLTTFSPRALVNHGFSAFIDMVRSAFAHAGGIRVDHILGLRRLWLVPEGESANQGAYLLYPLGDLLRLLALESWRHQAVVIGEDLGTVPPGLREQLAESGLLGMRVLWFEKEKIQAAASGASQSANKQDADRALVVSPSALDRDGRDAVDSDRADGALANAVRTVRTDGGNGFIHANNADHSDIADITDLSDLGHLDELTGIAGIISLNDDAPEGDADGDVNSDTDRHVSSEPLERGHTHARTEPTSVPEAVPDLGTAAITDIDSERVAPAQEAFVPPARWSHDAIAMTTTHDLPTIAGWWHGNDIAWRHRIGQSGKDETTLRRQQADRLTDRAQLWRTMAQAGLVPLPPAAGSTEPDQPPLDAILQLVAMTAAPLALFPMEDLLGLDDQPNLPGSIDEHPNWRRRLPLSLDRPHTATAQASSSVDAGLAGQFRQRLKLIDGTRAALHEPASAAPPLSSSFRKTARP